MSHYIGQYTNPDPFLDFLQERYGKQLELMPDKVKRTFRAALDTFLAQLYKASSAFDEPADIDSVMTNAITAVDPELWTDSPEAAKLLSECANLRIGDVDGLIEATTAQLRYGESDRTFITRQFNAGLGDDVLYSIGMRSGLLGHRDFELYQENRHSLTPDQRCCVLDWLIRNGYKVEDNLTLLIFGQDQLRQWYDDSKRRYPDFEMVLEFGADDEGIIYTYYYRPLPQAPNDISGHDFPIGFKSWESWEMFWGNFPNDASNELELTLSCYPNQWAFCEPNTIIDDYRLELDSEEQQHQTMGELLETASKLMA